MDPYKDLEPIYIIAYPKSGSTWLKRLVGEILDSPAGHISKDIGFEQMDEGVEKKGNYKILYSHYSKIDKPRKIDEKSKIIYIVRDFRDVVVSAFFHHYRIDENLVLLKKYCDYDTMISIKRLFWRGIIFNLEMAKLIRYWASIAGGKTCLDFLKKILTLRWFKDLKGSGVGRWDKHVLYWSNYSENVAVIKYEDMLKMPLETVIYSFKKINVPYNEDVIVTAIKNQLFSEKKKKFASLGLNEESAFMRKGINGDYKRFLNNRMINLIKKRYGKFMISIGYYI